MDARHFNDLTGNVRGAIAQVRGAQESIDELEQALKGAREEKAEAIEELRRAREALFTDFPELAPLEAPEPVQPAVSSQQVEMDDTPPDWVFGGGAPPSSGGLEFREAGEG